MLRGSSAIPQVARVIWAVDSPNSAKPDQRRLSVIKNNLAKRPQPVGFELPGNRIKFTVAPAPIVRATAHDEAIEFLSALLQNGPVTATDVRRCADTSGISRSTLDRAKRHLGVMSTKDGDCWSWLLPVEGEDVEEVEYLEEDDYVDDLQTGTSV